MLRQEPHGVTFQKTAFFIVTAVKTLNPTLCIFVSGKGFLNFIGPAAVNKSKLMQD
jgi:hypothetical protein